jgi:hypothetical protein
MGTKRLNFPQRAWRAPVITRTPTPMGRRGDLTISSMYSPHFGQPSQNSFSPSSPQLQAQNIA